MEGAVTSFVVQKLRELIMSEGQLLWAVKGDVQKLKGKLPMMQAFLEKFNSIQKRETADDPVLLEYILNFQEFVYDAEDAIESYILEAPSMEFRCGVQNILASCSEFINGLVALHRIGSQIKAINSKIDGLPTIAQTYGIDFTQHGQASSSKHDKQIEYEQSFSHVEENDIVGFEEDIKKLVKDLVDSENHVAIWGMGGLGKTTLARKLYHDTNIRRHFDCFGWRCITQKWEAKDVLKSLLIDLKSSTTNIQEKDYIHKMDISELTKELYEFQKEKKCLLVLDDVWSVDALRSISAAFPKGNTRSKIILTTRIKDVVPHIWTHMGQESILHELQLLSEEESWELFQRKAFSRSYFSGMEDIGRRIAAHCKRLPLAIVVLGGVLALKETIQDWNKVLKEIDIYLSQGDGQGGEGGRVMQVLDFSYQDLPYYLKPCFLYLGQYPEDSEINIESLVRKMVAEGIVSSDQYHTRNKTLVDVARGYVEELAGRSMVQLKLTKYSQRMKSCRLHDLVREFCLTKLHQQQDFLKVFNLGLVNGSTSASFSAPSTSSAAVSTRRLAILVDKCKFPDIKSCNGYNQRLRSISYFGEVDVDGSAERLFEGLKLLRILDLEGTRNLGSFKMFGEEVGKLIHLSYLSLRNTWFIELPQSLGNLRCIQTLDLRVSINSYLVIPNVLWKMEQLKHLYLPCGIWEVKGSPKLVLDTLKNLETLVNLDITRCDSKCILGMENLRKLKVRTIRNIEDVKTMLEFLSNLNNSLQHSSFDIVHRRTEEANVVMSQLLACHHLRKLEISGCLLTLPKYNEISPNIVFLQLVHTLFKEDPMPTLEKLPLLRRLDLDCAFMEKEMVCCAPEIKQLPGGNSIHSAGGFPQLKELRIRDLPNLEDWKVEKGAMPNLQQLRIDKCPKLNIFPEALQYVTTLTTIFISHMSLAFKSRIQKGGEDFCKIQHVPKVRILN